VALLVWLFVRDKPESSDKRGYRAAFEPSSAPRSLAKGIRTVLSEPAFWPFAIWFFFNSAIYFSYVGLWGGPYLMHVYGISKGEAGNILSFSAIGLMVGSPLVSYLSNRVFRRRKPVLVLSSIMALCLTAALAFATAELPHPALFLISFGFGATTGSAVVIAFTAVKELFPLQIAGTATGLVNLFLCRRHVAADGSDSGTKWSGMDTFTTTATPRPFSFSFSADSLPAPAVFHSETLFTTRSKRRAQPRNPVPLNLQQTLQKNREQSAGIPGRSHKSLPFIPSAAAMQS
jgi:hypothetical protein